MVMEERSGHTAYRVEEVQMGNGHKRGRSEDSSCEGVKICVEIDEQDFLSKKAQKWFFEKCVNLSAVDSPSFEETMTVDGGQLELKILDSHDLNGWMRQDDAFLLKQMQDRVEKIKDTWVVTGCSILLDAWVDQKGRDLVAFVADCPAGPVYLTCFNVSDIKNDVTALLSLVNGLVEEVGVHKVTQIIACTTSGWVGELGERFACHNREVFWSVSVSHCLELMLVNIEKTLFFGDILDKVNNIWEFINNNPSVWKNFRDHSHGNNITVFTSEYEFVTPYLTVESIFKARKNLAAMFASSDWKKGKGAAAISILVTDASFWKSVERVVKCTSHLIHGLLFSPAKSKHVGYIYDTLDSVKVSIAREFNHRKLSYKPLWDVIDDVWNKHLYNPLHAAGYFLNPTSFYSSKFHLDLEVTIGLISSLLHMVPDFDIQLRVAAQLDMYRLGEDCFNQASQADQIFGISPTEWWAQKASQHPELQSFAIKILSQKCEGATRYKLKRGLAEKLLLTEGLSPCEQKHIEELAFVHYNLHLQSCKAKLSEER